MYIGCVCFRDEFVFLNCDDICMCVPNKQFEIRKFVYESVMLTCSMMRFLSLLLLCLWSCGRLWSVCEVGMVPYVDEVVTVTVLRVLLLVLHVCMLRECKGNGIAGVGDG